MQRIHVRQNLTGFDLLKKAYSSLGSIADIKMNYTLLFRCVLFLLLTR